MDVRAPAYESNSHWQLLKSFPVAVMDISQSSIPCIQRSMLSTGVASWSGTGRLSSCRE